jgi:hypothetical protein
MTLALALFASLSSIAHADDRELAQQLFARAAEARDAGRWAEARDLLTQSLEAFPHFPTAWNLATALERLDDLAGAERVLARLERGELGAISERETRSVRERREALARMLGTLVVTVSPASAERVVLDGAVEAALRDGRAELRLVPGTHVVSAQAGEATVDETVSIVATETTRIHLALRAIEAPASGRLIVEAEDPEAMLSIAGVGRSRGRFDRELAPRTYEVELDGDTRRVDLGAGEIERVYFEESASIVESGWFWLTVGLVAAATGVVLGFVLLSGVADPIPADIEAPPL